MDDPLQPQKGFGYRRVAWHSWVGYLTGVSEHVAPEALPEKVDREVVADRVERLVFTETAAAFTIAMIWGHGLANYGPYRAARILTAATRPVKRTEPDPERCAAAPVVIERLEESARRARVDPVEGFRFLSSRDGKIRGLGPAFFTKWLYFATARGQARHPEAAPILDRLVQRWMREEARIDLSLHATDSYRRYVETLRDWGEPHGHGPVEVEERIFRLLRNDGSD